mmetsp:Transcript_2760/g.6295  ORF Transcript_2760/g.6295 Transcript_2760/m.6295 type:complete len:270 (-) Transcript_2760:561-1370(-)
MVQQFVHSSGGSAEVVEVILRGRVGVELLLEVGLGVLLLLAQTSVRVTHVITNPLSESLFLPLDSDLEFPVGLVLPGPLQLLVHLTLLLLLLLAPHTQILLQTRLSLFACGALEAVPESADDGRVSRLEACRVGVAWPVVDVDVPREVEAAVGEIRVGVLVDQLLVVVILSREPSFECLLESAERRLLVGFRRLALQLTTGGFLLVLNGIHQLCRLDGLHTPFLVFVLLGLLDDLLFELLLGDPVAHLLLLKLLALGRRTVLTRQDLDR